MKRNKLIIVITLLVSLFSMVGTASANEQNDIKVSVDGNLIEFDVSPKIISGRTLVPLRAVFEALDVEPVWNGETRTVTVSNEKITIALPIGSKIVTVNNYQIELDVPATIVDGRTLVPTRFIAESFGALVDWDNETRTVKISSNIKAAEEKKELKEDNGTGWSKEGEGGREEREDREERNGGDGNEGSKDGEGNEGSEGGEESGNELNLNETYDVVRKGARLIMNYDKKSNSFKGTVKNTTSKTLTKVRVEVHLSNGTELGPTKPVDLIPGEKVDVILQATTKAFDGWTPHAEVGGSEHGIGESSEGSESSEDSGEHGYGGD
ncbi:copper amine oxidase N-terminal domain-containing protein [Wukongibacter baidiensis]|uniref:copper amine oxidase N-terminal domain-containing protein n=1 Tax=Wukongibacter baidiensis TaxID=1723361 RepID=UPI003D7FFDF9